MIQVKGCEKVREVAMVVPTLTTASQHSQEKNEEIKLQRVLEFGHVGVYIFIFKYFNEKPKAQLPQFYYDSSSQQLKLQL